MDPATMSLLGGVLNSVLQMFVGPSVSRANTVKTVNSMYGNLPNAQNFLSTYAPPSGTRPWYNEASGRVDYEPPLFPSQSQAMSGRLNNNPALGDPQVYMQNRLAERQQAPTYKPTTNPSVLGGLFG